MCYKSEQRKKECYDESCLVDTGKMLAAKGLVMVEVTKKSDKMYFFKAKYIDFETADTKKTKSEYFKYNLDNYEELNKFGKTLIQNMFGKNETKEVMKEVIIKDNSKEKTVKDDEIEIKTTKKEEKNVEKFKIEFVTIPSGVEIYDSDNNLLGETPFFVNLPKGFTKFSFEKKGFDKTEREIHIKQNERINISLAEKIYNLKINSNISGAKVFIDNKEKGKTPYKTKLSKGKHKIKLTKDDFGDKEKEFEINKDETISFELHEKGKGGSGEMVKIPGKNFKMDVTEVTVEQFKKCVDIGKCSEKNFKTNSNSKYNNYDALGKENHPMNAVNWYGADEFCKWEGKRLPTEKEWEYAAKAGDNFTYSGSNDADEVAWYSSNSGDSTHEVATKKANKYGLYDMSGNVWEWAGTSGVIFGDFYDNDNTVRVDSRVDSDVDRFYSDIGFRCVQNVK